MIGRKVRLGLSAGLLALVGCPLVKLSYDVGCHMNDGISIGIKEEVRQFSPMPRGLKKEYSAKKGEHVDLCRGIIDFDGIRKGSLIVNGNVYSEFDFSEPNKSLPGAANGVCYLDTNREAFKVGKNDLQAQYVDGLGNVYSDDAVLNLK